MLGVFNCFPIEFISPDHANGGKVILPHTILEELQNVIDQDGKPLIFRLSAFKKECGMRSENETYCGVLDFTAEEGCCFVPKWMMFKLGLKLESDTNHLLIEKVDLERGNYVKLEPLTRDFFDNVDLKTLLEHHLKTFVALCEDDVLDVEYQGIVYNIRVNSIKPENKHRAICVNEADISVDFIEPPLPPPPPSRDEPILSNTFVPFSGIGRRLCD